MIFGCLRDVSYLPKYLRRAACLPLGKVFGILEQRVVAAEHVDASQEDLVRRVVQTHAEPADTLVPTPEVDLVEDLRRSDD